MADNYSFQHILLIDDSEIDVLVNRRLMELTQFTAHVTITSTAEEAVDFLRNEVLSAAQAPEIILLDMQLPGMSGFDFIDEFKKLPDFILTKTKVVILSVFQKQEKLDNVFENKFVFGQLEKPLTQESLRQLAKWVEEVRDLA